MPTVTPSSTWSGVRVAAPPPMSRAPAGHVAVAWFGGLTSCVATAPVRVAVAMTVCAGPPASAHSANVDAWLPASLTPV